MTEHDVRLVKQAIPLWHANMAWAKALLVNAFNLSEPKEILRRENHHVQQVPGTCWFVRPHGIGVDVFRAPGVGGIDFDFDKDAPDEWRLARFIEAQVNDGQLSYAAYRELLDDDESFKSAVARALHGV